MGGGEHRWEFFRSGGVDQVVLRSGQDLLHLEELDSKLWVALAMPVKGVALDPKTLEAIDTDHDGRIRRPEVLAAVRQATINLDKPDRLLQQSGSLPIEALQDETLRETARWALRLSGKAETAEFTLTEVEKARDSLASERFNGDGIVLPEVADSEPVRKVMAAIVESLGGAEDSSGKKGVDLASLDAFLAESEALSAWREQAKADPSLLPLGAATAAAWEAIAATRAKVEDYFLRCRLAAFDPRGATLMQSSEDAWRALGATDLAVNDEAIRSLPLAPIEAHRALPLRDGVNPAWAGALAILAERAVAPLLGAKRDTLEEQDWRALLARLAPYEGYLATQPVTRVAGLAAETLVAAQAPAVREGISKLIAQDLERAPERDRLTTLDTLLRLTRDLLPVLSNFVNFADFYGKRQGAFQVGTLFLDGKACILCMEVTDPARMASMAPLAGAYLVICDCVRAGEKKTIAAAITQGRADNLLVGRNGLFVDRQGHDWDATITRLVTQPISVREAFWSPYRKLVRMIEDQAAKRAAAAEEKSQAKLGEAATAVAEADKTSPKGPAKIDVGTVAAIGVAVGGIGAMVTGLVSAFLGMGMWIPVGFIGLLLAFSGPSMLLAYQKLRRRNLGPILDANSWAINVPVRINRPFGNAMTDVAVLPKGATRQKGDPYAEKRKPWKLYLVLLLLVALAGVWFFGKLDGWLPEPVRSSSVFGEIPPNP